MWVDGVARLQSCIDLTQLGAKCQATWFWHPEAYQVLRSGFRFGRGLNRGFCAAEVHRNLKLRCTLRRKFRRLKDSDVTNCTDQDLFATRQLLLQAVLRRVQPGRSGGVLRNFIAI